MTHEYANYMMQKLLPRCSLDQRVLIIRELLPHMSEVSRSTQGTHTLQSFVPLMTAEEEQLQLVERILTSFVQDSLLPNSTHFIQKVVAFFPLAATLPFFDAAFDHFADFSVNKNAICVLKRMISKLRESEKCHSQYVGQLRGRFLLAVEGSFDKIVQDTYGNYVVQFLFENFG